MPNNPANTSGHQGSCASAAPIELIKEKTPSTFEVEQTVKTQTSGKTLTLDSKTNHILVIAAEFGPPPTAAADGRGGRGRGPMIPDSLSILVVGK